MLPNYHFIVLPFVIVFNVLASCFIFLIDLEMIDLAAIVTYVRCDELPIFCVMVHLEVLFVFIAVLVMEVNSFASVSVNVVSLLGFSIFV